MNLRWMKRKPPTGALFLLSGGARHHGGALERIRPSRDNNALFRLKSYVEPRLDEVTASLNPQVMSRTLTLLGLCPWPVALPFRQLLKLGLGREVKWCCVALLDRLKWFLCCNSAGKGHYFRCCTSRRKESMNTAT